MSDFTTTQLQVLDLLQNNDHNMWIAFFEYTPESALSGFVTEMEERFQEMMEE